MEEKKPDMESQKSRITSLVRHEDLLSAANTCADVLLQAVDEWNFETSVLKSMEIIGRCLNADYVHVWQNETIDGLLHFVHKHQWLNDAGRLRTPYPADLKIPYRERHHWEETLLSGGYIQEQLSGVPPQRQNFFNSYEVKSHLVVPLLVKGQFWGLFSIADCRTERTFSGDEINIFRSVGLMIANSILRVNIMQHSEDTAAKLEAVISNYSGIIWSVDRNNVITLLNGLYLKALELSPGSFEGWKLDAAQQKNPHLNFIANIQKTFDEGPQDYIVEIDGKMFHAHTTPIIDNNFQATHIVGSIDDVTKILQLQEKLEDALKKAQDANQAKSDFLAKMSHEMRTPLNAIIGLSNLVLGAESFGEEEHLNIEKVYSAGITLLNTVNDILDISKISSGKLELVPVEYDVPSLLNDTITQSIMHVGDKPIQFTLEIDENLPIRLFGDDLRVKQMFNNLLSNAFKYTREGTVKLCVSPAAENDTVWLNVSVRDTGIGIKPENISTIFEDYGQVDAKANRKIMGTGLGLPITKKVVELMGGSINVESEYGKGSTFTLKIPQKHVTDTVIGGDIVRNLKNFHYSANKRQNFAVLEKIKLPYARVLVVDDVITNLDVARGLMKPYGMKIDCMTSGQEAVDSVRAGTVKYNAIFMDHMMPEMDGIETTQVIRSIDTDYAKNVPIIALTANAIVGNEAMFLSKGFQSFLSKPIDLGKLDTVIRQWVRDKEQEKRYPNSQTSAEEPTSPNNEAASLLDKAIAGLNIQKAIKQFGNDRESYLKVLRSFAANTPPLLESCKNVNKENLAAYGITVHGIKGSSRSIGAYILGDMAEALEKTAKSGDIDFVTDHNGAFLEAASKLLSGLGEILSQTSNNQNHASDKPLRDKPDDAVLSRLLTACKQYDMDGIEAAITDLSGCEYESGSELVDWLKSNAQLMNYREIIERLESPAM